MATPGFKGFDDPGIFVEIEQVNQIRLRVKAWREAGYPGVTGITKRLLTHWQAPETLHERRFFFCQLEAIETLIWLTEAPATAHGGIDIQGGSPHPSFLRKRLCKNPIFVSGHRQMMVWMVGLGSGFLFSQESSHVHGGIDIQGDGGGYEC